MIASRTGRFVLLSTTIVLALSGCADRSDSADLTPPPGFVAPPATAPEKVPLSSDRPRFGLGFFPVERDPDSRSWRWMGRRGEVVLPISGGRHRLRVIGWVPIDLLGKPPSIRLTLGTTVLDSFELQGQRLEKEWVVDDPHDPSNLALLVIETDATVRPSNDPRDLGVSIERIVWDRLAGPAGPLPTK
jgi:hypothetical protein